MTDDRIAFHIVAIAFQILFPVALVIWAKRRFGFSWRIVAFGALVFFVSQVILRLPIIQVAQLFLAPIISQDRVALILWLGVASITAGLFEETGRFLGYRFLLRRDPKTWTNGVGFGLGHGGFESAFLIAALSLVSLFTVQALVGMDTSALPPEQATAIQRQIEAATSAPAWLPLLGAWERIWAIAVHVALSLVVLQVFVQRPGRLDYRWMLLAIVLHGLFNTVATIPQFIDGLDIVTRSLLIEGLITLGGLIALWYITRTRRTTPPTEDAKLPEHSEDAANST